MAPAEDPGHCRDMCRRRVATLANPPDSCPLAGFILYASPSDEFNGTSLDTSKWFTGVAGAAALTDPESEWTAAGISVSGGVLSLMNAKSGLTYYISEAIHSHHTAGAELHQLRAKWGIPTDKWRSTPARRPAADIAMAIARSRMRSAEGAIEYSAP
jgi:hypothetical protein